MKATKRLSAILLTSLPALAAADPVEGLWKSEVDDGEYAHIQMEPCGSNLCGRVVAVFDEAGQIEGPTVGTNLVWDMMAEGDGAYGGGKILHPASGKTYNCKMNLNGDSLRVRGCFGPICGKQTWVRLN